MRINRKYFFDYIRGRLHKKLTVTQVKNYELILNECEAINLDTYKIAYILATVYWETGKTIRPLREYGRGKGKKYGQPAGPYNHRYYGRGFPQLTWLVNYEKQSKIHGVDFVKYPDKVMRPDYSAKILVQGMDRGDFTGRGLDHYINDSEKNYIKARYVVNGQDKAKEIAEFAYIYEKAIKFESPVTKLKTYKREAACTSLAGTAVVASTAVVGDSEIALKTLEIVIGPVMLFATTMFTSDWVGKQSPWSKKDDNDDITIA